MSVTLQTLAPFALSLVWACVIASTEYMGNTLANLPDWKDMLHMNHITNCLQCLADQMPLPDCAQACITSAGFVLPMMATA
jgi:hypothetical protein